MCEEEEKIEWYKKIMEDIQEDITTKWKFEEEFEIFKQKKRKEKLISELKTPKIHHLCIRLMCGEKW